MTVNHKKRVILIFSTLVLTLAMLLLGALKYSFLSPAMYGDNPTLSREENQRIKALVLDAVASRYTLFSVTNAKKLYTAEAINDPAFPWSVDEINSGMGLVCSVNGDFMTTVEKTADGDYHGIVTVKRLTETHYWHFAVTKADGQYRISSLALDI